MTPTAPGDSEEEEETGGEEPWNPDDDRAEKDYMKIAKQFMKEQLEALREAKLGRKSQPRQGQSQPQAMGLGALIGFGPPTPPPGIQFRRIENGFLMTYTQVKESHPGGGHLGQPLPLPAGAPEGLGATLAALPHAHRVEVFVKNAAEAQPHLEIALASLERLSKMPSGGFFL